MMKTSRRYLNLYIFGIFMLIFFTAGCGGSSGGMATDRDIIAPTIIYTDSMAHSTDVPLNRSISVLFSEPLNPTTVNTTTFTISGGSGAVSGVVSYANNTMIFKPSSAFTASAAYTATISSGVKDLAGNALTTALVWNFTTGAVTDNASPILISRVPVINAVDVPFNIIISALFSETLDPATINTSTFTLMKGAEAISGTVNYASDTITFNTTGDFVSVATYTAKITTGIKDLAGNALAADIIWSFTTGAAADVTPPTVISTDPAAGGTAVSLSGNISALFSEPLNPATVNTVTFTLSNSSGAVLGTVSYANKIMTFNPTSNLASNTNYTATISTGVKDLAGNALAASVIWNFTTGATVDNVAPTVISRIPATNATGVSLNSDISALFSEELNPTTISTTTFTVSSGVIPVSGTVSYLNNTVIFNPTSVLTSNTTYTATVTTGVKDLAGNALAASLVWSFTTGTTVAQGPGRVNLGTAGNFVILAKTAISTTGATNITGNIGVSPAARSYITGFSDTLFADNTYSESTIVTGKIYAANMEVPTPANMTTAISDMETAYTDAAGRTTPDFTELYAGNVSGQTLAPGLYKWGTGVLITNVGVTISGGANDVWIFQIAQDLTVDSAAIVTLAGGAQAKNIFWQVAGGTGVTIGTTAQFKGIVLAKKAIVLFTGATADGRLLAQTAVTMAANAVTTP